MKTHIISEILKYVDCFGTTFSFYSEKNRKLYTKFGGILTIFSIILGILLLILINIDDFSQKNPNTTTSTSKETYKNIKFGQEKIWIPWRIRDFGGQTINHNNLFYPIIYYYKGIRNYSTKKMDIYYEIINYKLCSETSMKDNSDKYIINMSLDQLYCIDMEDLDVGGSWDSNFLNLITFDLYNCKNGINYDEKNNNCTTYDKIREIAGDNNNFQFEMYYPIIHYQPNNKTNPIFVKYTNYFYHLSRYSNKIDRLYLQQYVLKDDQGRIYNDTKIISHWGIESISGDSYATGAQKDLMNEGSTSRFYSFNIYLKNEIVIYNRSYKKFFLIIADGLPIINIVFVIFRIFAKILKISSRNKKLTELLFENLKEKKTTLMNIKKKRMSMHNSNFALRRKTNNLFINAFNNMSSNNENANDCSNINIKLTHHYGPGKKLSLNIEKESFPKGNNLKSKFNPHIANNSNKKNSHKFLNLNYNMKNTDIKNMNPNIKNFELLDSNKSNNIFNNLPLEDLDSKNEENEQKIYDNKSQKNTTKSQYVKKSLFPYKYYLCSIFIKNFSNSRSHLFFTKKFIIVYNFICQLFDISSYLILQREFQIMKSTLTTEKYRNIIESSRKINVNEPSFQCDMKECLSAKNLAILGKVNQVSKSK